MRFVELRPQAVAGRAHALEQEGNAEEVDLGQRARVVNIDNVQSEHRPNLVLIHHYINRGIVDERIVHTKTPREASSLRRRRAPDTELSAGLGNSGIVDRGRGSLEKGRGQNRGGREELHDAEEVPSSLST